MIKLFNTSSIKKVVSSQLKLFSIQNNFYRNQYYRSKSTIPISKIYMSYSRYNFSSFQDQFNQSKDQEAHQLKEFKMYFQLSNKLYQEKKLNQSIQALEKARSIIVNAKCTQSTVYIELILNLVVLYKEAENSTKIKQYLEEGLALVETLEGQNDQIKLIIYGNLSDLYFNHRNFQKSLKLLEQSQQIFVRTGKKQSVQAAILYEKIAQILIQQEEYQKSIGYLLKSKELIDKNQAQESQSYINLLDKLGFSYYKLKKYQEAVQSHQLKLNYQQKIIGRNSLAYAQTLKTLGFMHRHLDNQQKSIEQFQKAFDIAQDLGQLNNPSMYLVSQFLAVYKFQRQQYEQALIYFNCCMQSLQASNLKTYSKYTYILKSIADCHKFTKKYEDSFEKYEDLLSILDPKSSQYAYVLGQIGQLHFIWFQYQKSLDTYLRSLQIDIQANQNKETLHSYNIYEALIHIGQKLQRKQIVDKYTKLKAQYEQKNSQFFEKNQQNS